MPIPKFRAGDLVEFVPSGVRSPPGVWYCENSMGEEVPIRPEDDINSLTKAIQRAEYSLLPEAIKHVKHQIQVTTH